MCCHYSPSPHPEDSLSKGYANLASSFMFQKACYLLCLFCFCAQSTMEKQVWWCLIPGNNLSLMSKGLILPKDHRLSGQIKQPFAMSSSQKSTWQNRRGFAIKNLGDKGRVEKVWNCLQEQSAKQKQLPCFVEKISRHNRSWSPYASLNHYKHKLERAVGEMNW